MSTLDFKALAKNIFFKDELMWVELTDGRQIGVPISYFPRLLDASETDREDYVISGGGIGIHWDNLDEDISVRGLLLGLGDQSVIRAEAA